MELAYTHLNDETNDLVKLEKNVSIHSLSNDIVIEHPKIKEIHSILKQLMVRPKKPRMQNILIIGESNIGKT